MPRRSLGCQGHGGLRTRDPPGLAGNPSSAGAGPAPTHRGGLLQPAACLAQPWVPSTHPARPSTATCPPSPQHRRVPLDQGLNPRLVPTLLSAVPFPGSGRCQPGAAPATSCVDFGRRQPRLFLGATSQVVSRCRQPVFPWPRGKRLIIIFFFFPCFYFKIRGLKLALLAQWASEI